MLKRTVITAGVLVALLVAQPGRAVVPPPVDLIAVGTVSPVYQDFATQTAAPLESGIPGNRLGGIGSGLAYLGEGFFLALPDRGPNAADYNDCADALDNTTSYINRFHTFHLSLAPSDAGAALPFTLTPMLVETTLLSSHAQLVYGAGCGAAGAGAPDLNEIDHTHYFTGRSDNFDPTKNSLSPNNARFDPESIRVSNNRHFVYISDEYGPYVYEFDRSNGNRTKVFTLPPKFAITHLSAHGDDEISFANNPVGRIANKGMEGLAITPDGKMLVGAMQSPLEQDGGDVAEGVIRIVTININNGATREYAYQLGDGSGKKTTVSDILAINNHEFLVDERDSKGLADDPVTPSSAAFKRLYRIDLDGATDVGGLAGKAALAANAVFKPSTPFLDIVDVLNTYHGISKKDIPAKLEGIAFGQDVTIAGQTKHTLFVGNDNDFTAVFGATNMNNPNQFFVFAFTDFDLPGYEPQEFKPDRLETDRDR